MTDGTVLSTNDDSGCWAWAGARLSPRGQLEATQRFADLSWNERRDRLARQEMAWLAGQWDPPAPGCRFEVRFATGPATDKVQAAFLVRVLAAAPADARHIAGQRLQRAVDPQGALPSQVEATPIGSGAELRTWLGYPRQIGGFLEIRKHVSAGRVTRGGAPLAHAVRHGFFDSGAAWDVWWRNFAALRFPAVLSVGFDSYDANNQEFRSRLQSRAAAE